MHGNKTCGGGNRQGWLRRWYVPMCTRLKSPRQEVVILLTRDLQRQLTAWPRVAPARRRVIKARASGYTPAERAALDIKQIPQRVRS